MFLIPFVFCLDDGIHILSEIPEQHVTKLYGLLYPKDMVSISL